MEKNGFSHLLCMDFESWVVSRKINKYNLSNAKLRQLDNDYIVSALQFVLDVLKKYNQKITFFVVFKLEELYPGLLKKIQAEGHEIGWHGYSHSYIDNEKILKNELEASKNLLQKYHVKGFQAPNIVFFKEGYNIVKDWGFLYSSSTYGNSGRIYNFDGIYELPVSVANQSYNPSISDISFPSSISLENLFRFGIPFGSSYFWSILKKEYYAKKLSAYSKKGEVANLFIHNWQLIMPKSKSKKYIPDEQESFLKNPLFLPYKISVNNMFEHLLANFSFQTCMEYLKSRKIV